jgi:hypothetical protein
LLADSRAVNGSTSPSAQAAASAPSPSTQHWQDVVPQVNIPHDDDNEEEEEDNML